MPLIASPTVRQGVIINEYCLGSNNTRGRLDRESLTGSPATREATAAAREQFQGMQELTAGQLTEEAQRDKEEDAQAREKDAAKEEYRATEVLANLREAGTYTDATMAAMEKAVATELLNQDEKRLVTLVFSAFDKDKEGTALNTEEEGLLGIAERFNRNSLSIHSQISGLEHARKAKVSSTS